MVEPSAYLAYASVFAAWRSTFRPWPRSKRFEISCVFCLMSFFIKKISCRSELNLGMASLFSTKNLISGSSRYCYISLEIKLSEKP